MLFISKDAGYPNARTPCSVLVRLEEKLDVKLLLEKSGTSLSVAKVFGGVPAGLNLKGNGTALEGGAEPEDALTVRVI